MQRTKRIQVGSAVVAIAGAALTAHRVAVHTEGSFGWRFFVGLSLAIMGGMVWGAAALHTASDRERVYRLGYAAGRLDTIREMNESRPAPVIPLRPAQERQVTPPAAGGRPARPSRHGRGRAERADSHA